MNIQSDDDAQADTHAAMQAGSLEDKQPRRQAAMKTGIHAGSRKQAGSCRHASRQAGRAGKQAIETWQNAGKNLAKS